MQTNRCLKISLLICSLCLVMVSITIPTVSAAPDAAAIYTAKCAKCHGTDGRGVEKYKKKGVKDFTDGQWQKTRSDAQFAASINNGKGDVMPAWKAKLSPEEVKVLVGFVRAFKK
jgi:mono/diheme cytochrome c family protein